MRSKIAIAVAVTGLLAVSFLAVDHITHQDRASGCRSNLSAWILIIAQYRQDNDVKYPPVAGSRRASGTAWIWTGGLGGRKANGEAYGWAEVLYPYGGSLSIYSCPDARQPAQSLDSRRPHFMAYWLNGNLGGLEGQLVQAPAQTLMLGEGTDAPQLGISTDATFHRRALPPAWLADPNSPLFRHLGGSNYAFTDGHAKWLRPDQVKNFGGRPDPFSIR